MPLEIDDSECSHSNTVPSSLPSPTTKSATSCPSSLLTTYKWSHKKFGCRKQQAAANQIDPLVSSPQSHKSNVPPCSSLSTSRRRQPRTKSSPGKEEKKKKRRESDAKWRSNLSVCFQHLETKALRSKKCLKSRLSKEMIVQNTVRKVQYLEAVFMLLNQADKYGRTHEFSPMKGHQHLQAARKEFANKYYRYKKEKVTSTIQNKQSASLAKNTAFEKDPLADGVVPELGKAPASCEQLVPSSVVRRADETKEPLAVHHDQDVPSTPTIKSLICYEHDLPDDDRIPNGPKFTTKNVILNRYSGSFPQFKVTAPRPQLSYSCPRTPSGSPARKPFPLTPSFYSPPVRQRVGTVPYSPPPCGTIMSDGSPTANPEHPDPNRSPGLCRATRNLDWRPASNHPLDTSPSRSPRCLVNHSPLNVNPDTAINSRVKKRSRAALFQPKAYPDASPAASCGGASSYQVPDCGLTTTPSSSPAKSASGSTPGWSPATSPAGSWAVARGKTTSQLLYWSPVTSPVRGQSKAASSSPHLVMSSPSKRYKIRGDSISSVEETKPSVLASDSQTTLDSSLDGRGTPDLMCQEVIPFWKDDEKSPKLTPNTTPHSASFLNSSKLIPSTPTKKHRSNWSAKFVSVVRQSHHKDQVQASSSLTKSKRCKRLFTEDTEKAKTPTDDSSGINKTRVTRKYHKRATAARIRPWDPVANKVSSPVYGTSRLPNYPKKSKTPTSSASFIIIKSSLSQPATHQTVAKMLQRQRDASHRSPVIMTDEDETKDQETDDILDVDSTDFRNTPQAKEVLPDKTSQIDQDNSQGSLLLNEIPQLPDDMITPLLLCGESDSCLLDDVEPKRSLLHPRYSKEDRDNLDFQTIKLDDDIVLTILQLEESSRSSASTRSSPDSIDNLNDHPRDTAALDSEIVDVMEIVPSHQEEFPDYLQETLLKQYDLMGAESHPACGPPFMILSPIRMSKFSEFENDDLPEKAQYYLLSPIKREAEDIRLELEAVEKGDRVCGTGHHEDEISESMARFASCALNRETLTVDYQQLSQDMMTNLKDVDAMSCDEDQAYNGATQTLLNGQIISKRSTCFQVSPYPAHLNLISFDPGTPSKGQSHLMYSPVPSTATMIESYSIRDTQAPSTETKASDTPPYVLSPSSAASYSPSYPQLSRMSQSSTYVSSSPDLSQDAYRLPQLSPFIKQEPWDWTDPDLEGVELLDNVMGDDLLAKYYRTYNCLSEETSALNKTNYKETSEVQVPDWQTENSDTSQASLDSTPVSSMVTYSTGSSQDSACSDHLLYSGLQVVPSLNDEE